MSSGRSERTAAEPRILLSSSPASRTKPDSGRCSTAESGGVPLQRVNRRVCAGQRGYNLSQSAQSPQEFQQLPADSWDRPTPSEISVRELIEHVVVGNRFTALMLAGVDRDESRARVAGDQLGDDPVAAVVDSARQQKQAFAETGPEQPVAGPMGDIPAAEFFRFRLADLVVHAWDLLRGARLHCPMPEPTASCGTAGPSSRGAHERAACRVRPMLHRSTRPVRSTRRPARPGRRG
jgi:uncharacterized protein (TIGR03086 family)